MEGVDHVHIVEVGRGGLVSDIDGMLQRKTPHRESLEFGISGFHTALMLVIELAEAHGHLAAARAGSRHDHQRTSSLDKIVFAEAFVGIDQIDIAGVSLDGIMAIGCDAHARETRAESIGAALPVVVGDYHRADHKPAFQEFFAEAQHIHAVCYPQIIAHLILLDIARRDHNHDFRIVAQLAQHTQLAVGLETG